MGTSGFAIVVDVTGDGRETADLLDMMSDRAADLTPAFSAMILSFQAMERRRFDTEGPGWAELAPSTIATKVRYGYPLDILRRTGAMEASIAGGSPGSILEMDDDGFFVGSDVTDPRGRHYIHYHQQGTANMPARVVVRLTPSTLTLWATALKEWIFGASEDVVGGIAGEADIEEDDL